MKTFKASLQLNRIIRNPMESINYECEKFDLEIIRLREVVLVNLGQHSYECVASEASIQFDVGLTSVTFTVLRQIL